MAAETLGATGGVSRVWTVVAGADGGVAMAATGADGGVAMACGHGGHGRGRPSGHGAWPWWTAMTHATRASDGADGVCAERPKTARARVGRKMTTYKTKKITMEQSALNNKSN